MLKVIYIYNYTYYISLHVPKETEFRHSRTSPSGTVVKIKDGSSPIERYGCGDAPDVKKCPIHEALFGNMDIY